MIFFDHVCVCVCLFICLFVCVCVCVQCTLMYGITRAGGSSPTGDAFLCKLNP